MYLKTEALSLRYFAKYRWYLKALGAKRSEKQKIIADINSGLISRDTLDENWQRSLNRDIATIKRRLKKIEETVDSLPDTSEFFPCKLLLRLHFIMGMTMTDTAAAMNVSVSTLRRIYDRTVKYFDRYPPE